MNSEEIANRAGEEDLAALARSGGVGALLAAIMAKWGLVGLVVVYFGWQTHEMHTEVVNLTQQCVQAMQEHNRALDALTHAVDRLTK